MFQKSLASALTAACVLAGAARAEGTAAQPSTAVKAKLARAYQLAADKKSAEAIAAFNAVLKADPRNHEAAVELGYLHAGLKHHNSAVRYLRGASEQDPTNLRLRMDLGYAYQNVKDYAAAAKEFEAVAKEPGEFQEQAQAAAKALGGAAAMQAQTGRQKLLDEAYAALRKGDKTNARRRFEEAAKRDPRDPATIKQLGFLNLEQGRIKAAAANFETARELEPENHFVSLQLGYLYQRLQKKDQARDAFGAALASTDPKIHDAAQAALLPLTAGDPAAGTAAPATPSSPNL